MTRKVLSHCWLFMHVSSPLITPFLPTQTPTGTHDSLQDRVLLTPSLLSLSLSLFHFLDQKLQSLLTSVVYVPQLCLLSWNSNNIPQIHFIKERDLFCGPECAGANRKRDVISGSLAPQKQGVCRLPLHQDRKNIDLHWYRWHHGGSPAKDRERVFHSKKKKKAARLRKKNSSENRNKITLGGHFWLWF